VLALNVYEQAVALGLVYQQSIVDGNGVVGTSTSGRGVSPTNKTSGANQWHHLAM
jgi:hypothetical protein